MKTEYLACYDYGTGGIWAYLMADSAAQIRERFPELHVVTDRPKWLTDQQEQLLREQMTIDIDDTETHSSLHCLSNETESPIHRS